MNPETGEKVIFVPHKSPYVNLYDTDFTLSQVCPDGFSFGRTNAPYYFFMTNFKEVQTAATYIWISAAAEGYSSCFLWTKTTSHLPLLNFVRDFHQEENKVLFARTKGMHAAEKQAFFRRICAYLQISPDVHQEGVTARDKYAESFLRVVKPLFDRRIWRMEDGLVELKRLASVPIEERERAFAEVSQSLVYLYADRLSLNFERPYWDRALDLRAGARQAYLTRADEVIKTVGTNKVSHIRELVQVIYDVTPEKRVLIQEYTQRIAAEFSSLNTRRNLVMALVYCGWRNAEECEVFVNAAFTLIRAFDEAKVPLASAYKILRDLRKCSDAYTDPSFVPDLLPVFLTAKETHSAQLMEDLKGVDSASRQQVSRLVAEALKDSDGNVGRLEPLVKALKKIASPEEREEIMKIASPFFAEMRLARAYAEVIEAIANVEREKREEFVARLAETKKGRTMPWAIKLALSDMHSAKRGRDEQAVSVGASSSASSSSSSVVDDVEEIVDAPLVASLSSSSSNDESDDEGTTSLKKARRN